MRECMAGMCPTKPLRISELNPHLLCALCGGYLIDATTIIECLHSFCKTCILRYLETSNYCPICEVLIHKTRPWQNIRLDHALQNAVYKMVPGLFRNEMKRRREFYEQQNLPNKSGQPVGQPQGQIGDRIIFSQDEEFSVSIEFSPDGKPVREAKTKHLKRSSDIRQCDKRYLKCPAGLRVSHLKKFIRLKFTLPQHIQIDLFYESEPLFDSYSLMDVAYIYLWKRDCVLRLFYSFFQMPTKKRKLQSVTHISETLSKPSKVLGKPEKNFGDRKSSNKKEKADSKKQGRMSGKKKRTAKAGASSPSNASQQEALVAKGAFSSNLKRKHSDISSTKDSSCLSRSGTTTLDTSSCSKRARCVDTLGPVKQHASVHTTCQPGSKQTPSSSECSPSSQLCGESTNCSIISHHSRESSACSVTSHFCTENTQCSIVSHPCGAHRNRNSQSPADSEVSITLLIKSSDSCDYQRGNGQQSPPGGGQATRLQKGENTSEITYNTFLNGDTISELKDNTILVGGKFSEVKNTILQKCKNESKVTQRNIQNRKVVSEVKVSVNGKLAPELKNKQLVNGQFIFRVKNGKITNGEVLSTASDGKTRFNESSVMDTRCQSGNKNIEVTCFKSGRNLLPCEEGEVRCAGGTKFDENDKKIHGVSLVKKMKIHTKDNLDMKCNSVHYGDSGSGDTSGKLDVDRISEVKDNTFQYGDSVFDKKDNKLMSFEKVSCVMDKNVEINNEVCGSNFENSEATSEFTDKKLSDVIAELKDENSSVGEISSLRKDKAFVHSPAERTAHSFEQANSDTNPCSIKLERTALSTSSQLPVLDTEDKKIITGSEQRDLNLTSDGKTPVIEDRSPQPHIPVHGSSPPSEIVSASQLLQSETCVDKEQVVSTSGAGDYPSTPDSEIVKDLCYDTNKNNIVEFKDPLSSRSDSPSADVHQPSNPRLQKPAELETQPSGPIAKDVSGDTKENQMCPGSQISRASSKVNSIIDHAKTPDTRAAKTESLSNQLASEGSSNYSDCTILILPTMKSNGVNKIRQSISETVSALKPVSTKHETWKRSVSPTSAKTDVSENLTRDSLKQHSAPNKVKNMEEECRKHNCSPKVLKEILSSEQKIDTHNDISESANLISKKVPTLTSKTVTLQGRQTSVVSTTGSSEKPLTPSDVTRVPPSPKPLPLKRVQSAAGNIGCVSSSRETASVVSTASTLPTSANCLMSTSVTGTSSLTSFSASLLTKLTAAVKTHSSGTKPLAVKTSSPQSCTGVTAAAGSKAVGAVSHRSFLAVSSLATRNKCLSSCTVGKGGTYWSNRQSVSASMSNIHSLPQDAPPQVNKSVFIPTSGSSDVSQPRVSGSNNIPSTSTSGFSNSAHAACVVSSFLNLPPSEASPVKRPQPRKHPDSTNISSTKMTLPSEAVKVDNFLFDIKSPERELHDSYSQNRVSSSCGKDAPNNQFRIKLNLQTQLGGVTTDKSLKVGGVTTGKSPKLGGVTTNKSPKRTESHITAVHNLPKTVSQTTRPYSMARSVSTSPSSSTNYSNIIQTTKISTLIPKSSAVSSRAGAFPKTPSYPAHINSLLLSRRILNNSLASHYQRIEALSSISGASCRAQELTPKPCALSSPSSPTPSSLVSSTTSVSHHKMSPTSRQSSKGTSDKSDKSPKHKTIPPLCIPKSSLIGPTTLKLQRSPGSNDHYIFTPLLHYSSPSQHKMDRAKSKESKHKTSHSRKSAHTGAKGTVNSPSKQRVPSIKISDINRNPVIVENGGSGNSNNSNTNSHYHSPCKSYNHESSGSSALGNATPRAHGRGRNEGNSSTGHHDKMPVRDILRPSDSELLLSRHWHAYSTAELLFSGFSMPAHSKLHDLQYDTDAMPLDYSQSSSKS